MATCAIPRKQWKTPELPARAVRRDDGEEYDAPAGLHDVRQRPHDGRLRDLPCCRLHRHHHLLR
uniref:Uncharacterized protein n=1 Tax=Arundo donax TaxID=35708 RepID=A0A0A9ECJ5_ARUDO